MIETHLIVKPDEILSKAIASEVGEADELSEDFIKQVSTEYRPSVKTDKVDEVNKE